jgi:4a-hydroxytetrahydrobiopterin dehydratase
MARPKKLTDQEVRGALKKKTLKGWSIKGGKLHREYVFEDFVHAFGFMATSAIAIEAQNHHPDWSNSWNRVRIDLTTHDAGGLTQGDLVLAEKLEAIAAKLLG